MINDRFEFKWIGYCDHNKKMWAWFTDNQQEVQNYKTMTRYCIWGVVGKKLSINSHNCLNLAVYNLIRQKEHNGYVFISNETLLEMWPSFYDELERKFIWAKLSEQI